MNIDTERFKKDRIKGANNYIKRKCKNSPAFKYSIEILDKFDFSNFLGEGRSLSNLLTAIEEEYGQVFCNIYNLFVFDELDIEDIQNYFISRYNVWFQEYSDWVVRHNNAANL